MTFQKNATIICLDREQVIALTRNSVSIRPAVRPLLLRASGCLKLHFILVAELRANTRVSDG